MRRRVRVCLLCAQCVALSLLVHPDVAGAQSNDATAASGQQPSGHESDGESAEAPPAVVVRGRRRPLQHARRDPTAASTVVRGEALRGAGKTSVDVLQRVPGVQISRTGAQSDLATASIRGSDAQQVPVYVAGIRINDDVSGTADLSTVPLWMMERVEVFRGNAPENADRLGLGGAIFFWPRLPETTRVGAGSCVGSFGSRGGWIAGEVGSRKAGALVAVRRSHADNDYLFLDDDGRRFDRDERLERRRNADFTSHDAWAVGRYQLAPGARVSLVVNAFEREQGLTGLSVIPADRSRGTARRYLLGVSTRLPCQPGNTTCRLELSSSLIVGSLSLHDPAIELPALRTRALHNRGERSTHRAAVRFDAGDRVEVGTSVWQAFENIRIDRVGNSGRRGKRSTTRWTAHATWRVSPELSAYGLAGVECHSTEGLSDRAGSLVAVDSGTCGVLAPVGRLGASYRVSPDVEVLGNVGRFVRVPTLAELFGISPLVQGNAELTPETGFTGDLGVRATVEAPEPRAGVYALDAFVFARRADDLIRFRTTSLKAAAPFNVASARILGAEASAAAEWLGALQSQSAITLLDPRETTEDPTVDPTTNDILPLTSRLVASTRFEVFAKPALAALRQDRVGLALRYLHRSSRFADAAGQTVLPAQHFVDLEATTSHLDERVTARFAVRNVLNSRQLDLIGLPVPGRSFNAEVEAWW